MNLFGRMAEALRQIELPRLRLRLSWGSAFPPPTLARYFKSDGGAIISLVTQHTVTRSSI